MNASKAPTIYLGYQPNSRCRGTLTHGPRAIAGDGAPAILVAFPQLQEFLRRDRLEVRVRSYCVDSGAFSVWNTGATVDLEAYVRVCQHLLSTDELLEEVFALDDIASWRTTVRNTERMWAAGVPAIPTFHIGEPEEVLVGLSRDYPKVGIGGIARLRGTSRQRFAEQVFARVWPKRLHGFGVSTRDMLLSLPWHSTDATSWETGPGAFGRWRSFGGRRLSVRGSQQDLRREVQWYLDLERLAQHRWAKELSEVSDSEAF